MVEGSEGLTVIASFVTPIIGVQIREDSATINILDDDSKKMNFKFYNKCVYIIGFFLFSDNCANSSRKWR